MYYHFRRWYLETFISMGGDTTISDASHTCVMHSTCDLYRRMTPELYSRWRPSAHSDMLQLSLTQQWLHYIDRRITNNNNNKLFILYSLKSKKCSKAVKCNTVMNKNNKSTSYNSRLAISCNNSINTHPSA